MARAYFAAREPKKAPRSVQPAGPPTLVAAQLTTFVKAILRITSRVGWNRKSRPTMSVKKPGVSSSAPPEITRPPSAVSFAGTLPSPSAARKRSHEREPSRISSQAPKSESATRRAIVHQTPIIEPT
ncbi:MAG: hypothetical protein NTZ58_00620 [Solirubrobacterales bacterium]|nr:hypothetical protein [Solirubrobacterales bacterium]